MYSCLLIRKMRQLSPWPLKIRHLIKGTRSRDFYSLTRYGRRTPRLRHSFLFLLAFIIPGGNIAKRLMHMASQVTESVQTSPFGGAETMIFPVPYRITTRSNASLRQPGKYTKATGGNGGWDGDVSHQSFLVPKYPSLYGILCIPIFFILV